jgi:hypothetical protein
MSVALTQAVRELRLRIQFLEERLLKSAKKSPEFIKLKARLDQFERLLDKRLKGR